VVKKFFADEINVPSASSLVKGGLRRIKCLDILMPITL
jgi:hypothetical protein